MKTKIFFSGNPRQDGPLELYCRRHNWQLTAQPLIGFEPVAFEMPADVEIVFFSSPRSVHFFFDQLKVDRSYTWACVGEGTARALRELQLIPDFVGEKSGDPESVARAFVAFAAGRKVFFPVSSRSNETIVQYIPENQRRVAVCYETKLMPLEITPQDIYVFTSPSNVESFLSQNSIPSGSVVISWGKSTDKKIVEMNHISDFVLEVSNEEELIKLLNEKYLNS